MASRPGLLIDGWLWYVELGDLTKDEAFSVADFTTNTITIQEGLSYDRFMASLMHEVCHVILYHGGAFLSDKDDERVATLFGHSLLKFWQANDLSAFAGLATTGPDA